VWQRVGEGRYGQKSRGVGAAEVARNHVWTEGQQFPGVSRSGQDLRGVDKGSGITRCGQKSSGITRQMARIHQVWEKWSGITRCRQK
jgi:hypothetical protein